MFKFILILLVALGASLYFPASRAVVVDTVRPVLDPAMRWSTNGQMDRITRDLATADRTSTSIPETQAQFQRWLGSRYMTENAALDAWKTPYRIEVGERSFRVISAGPDREFGTADDLVSEGERTARERRR
jgi:hypothetical protein